MAVFGKMKVKIQLKLTYIEKRDFKQESNVMNDTRSKQLKVKHR